MSPPCAQTCPSARRCGALSNSGLKPLMLSRISACGLVGVHPPPSRVGIATMLQCRGWPRNRAATGAGSAPGLRAGWQHQVSLSDRYPIGPWSTGPFAPTRCTTKARTQRPPRATQLSRDRRTGTASEGPGARIDPIAGVVTPCRSLPPGPTPRWLLDRPAAPVSPFRVIRERRTGSVQFPALLQVAAQRRQKSSVSTRECLASNARGMGRCDQP
jgi:hypothetical protein